MEISSIVKIFQADAAYLIKNFSIQGNKEQEDVKAITTGRLISVGLMTLAAISAAKTVVNVWKNSFEFSLLMMGYATVVYVLSHDAFVVMKNLQYPDMASVTTSLFDSANKVYQNATALLSGDKKIQECLCYPLTAGTYLKPFWDELLKINQQ